MYWWRGRMCVWGGVKQTRLNKPQINMIKKKEKDNNQREAIYLWIMHVYSITIELKKKNKTQKVQSRSGLLVLECASVSVDDMKSAPASFLQPRSVFFFLFLILSSLTTFTMHVTCQRLCTLIMNTDLGLLEILLLLSFWSPAGEIPPNFTNWHSIFNTSRVICVTVSLR